MARDSELRCVIATGGTAGHVLPSLAVAEALSERGVQVTFAGSPDRAEAQLVPEAGYELDTFEISGLPRRPGPALARALARAMRAPVSCTRILTRRRPQVVLGGGGYVAGPMVVAAAARKIPAGLTEADVHLGLANRLAAPFARRVFLAFPIQGREAPKYHVTGRPIPFRNRPLTRAEGRRRFDLPVEVPLLLVFGGSQGSRALNELALDTFGKEGPAVIHLCGARYYDELRRPDLRGDYRLMPFTDEFGAALGAADLALSRAGGSVWELAAAGLPAVLVPWPGATAGHQTQNARFFEEAGGAVVVAESELGRVPEVVRELVGDQRRLTEMRAAMLRIARPDAAEVIAEELIGLARARG
jgi:UDP-N-acetylglucosamine--N-acetylmuramyl-(pentapeptide) pyrophosphoryl-undecaprenol N-acetylglucosamine transferase